MCESSRQKGSSPQRVLYEVKAYEGRKESFDRCGEKDGLVRLLDAEEESNLRRANSLDEFMETTTISV